jgi:EmrB/QacA subfamily drug resistance transporter
LTIESINEGERAGRLRRALLCCAGTSFLIMLDSNIVAVSLPAIARDMHAAFSDVEWVVSAYVLSFAAVLLPAGSLADRLGRRRILFIGLAIFSMASLLCGIAQSSAVLNWSRALQGVGAALQLSAALGLLGHTFEGPERPRAFAFWGVVVGAAVAIGPLLGGIITSTVGWRWAFLVNVPVGLGLIALGSTSLDESRDVNAQRLDLPGIILFAVGLFCLVWAAIEANTIGWSSTPTLVRFAIGAVLLALFVVVERVRKTPMMDLTLFRRSNYLGSTFAMFGYAFAGQVMMTLLPLYLQSAHGWSPFTAGLAMMPFAIPLMLSPRLAGRLANKLSSRMLLTLGLAVIGCGDLLTAISLACSGTYVAVALGMMVSGAGTGLLNGETTKAMISAVPPERAGMAGGLTGTTRFVGIVAGISVLGAVLAAGTEHHVSVGLTSLGAHWSADNVHELALRAAAGTGSSAGNGGLAADVIQTLAHASFAAGFAWLLLVAGVVALASAGLTYAYVQTDEAVHRAPAMRTSAETEL